MSGNVWPPESIPKWDGRITETLHEEWISDDDGPKNINRLFYKYFTNPQGNPEHPDPKSTRLKSSH